MISDSVDLYQPFGVLLGVLHRTQPALESIGRRPRKPQLEKTFWKCSKATISIHRSQQPAKAVLTSLLRAMTLCAPSSEIDEVDSFKESLLYAPITQLLLLPQGATASHPLLSLSHPPTISDPPTPNSVSASVSLSCSHSPDLTHFKAKQCCQAWRIEVKYQIQQEINMSSYQIHQKISHVEKEYSEIQTKMQHNLSF